MFALTEALERIWYWLKIHRPDFADSFQPGISAAEIRAGEMKLGFKLPSEVYELYQWRNGTQQDETSLRSLVSPNPCFLPFSEAISSSESYNQYLNGRLSPSYPERVQSTKWYEDAPIFILAIENGEVICIPLGATEENEKPPVIFMGEGGTELFFDNLTGMMQTLAEGYETGAYYFDSENYLIEDCQKVAFISRKYNPVLYNNLLINLRSLTLESNDLETSLEESL